VRRLLRDFSWWLWLIAFILLGKFLKHHRDRSS